MMTHSCQNCKTQFEITDGDLNFYSKIQVPPPTFCPECRYQRRLANRNEWNFYKRDCSLCGGNMVSIYNPSYPGPVYCGSCWWSDKWDPLSYGREVNFSRPFFGQFQELRESVPRITLANSNSVNSEYSNQAGDNKNCYMVVATGRCEDCMYGSWNMKSTNCVDCWAVEKCELMYESLSCQKCYRCLWAESCVETTDSYFSKDCRGCSSCFGCTGLRNKSHYWFNEPLAKDEYQSRLRSIRWSVSVVRKLREEVAALWLRHPVKYRYGRWNLNATGDYIDESKNTFAAFNCRLSENLKYGQDAWEARDCMDLTETLDNELDYEMEGAGWGSRCVSSAKSWDNNRILYCDLNHNCSDLFGCVCLRTKSHCILNKQYTASEYAVLKDKLIQHMKKSGEWGQFFPAAISPFPYNDSLAQDYFPLTKKEAESRGLRWYDRDPRDYRVTLPHQKLPEEIGGVSDNIIGEMISCSSQDSEAERASHPRCATAFRIIPAELQFYRRMNIPVPHKCSYCRLQERLARRNPRKLWSRECQCAGATSLSGTYKNIISHAHGLNPCPNKFETSYSPERLGIAYCEDCYNAEVA